MDRSITAGEVGTASESVVLEPVADAPAASGRILMGYWLGALATSSLLWLVLLIR